MPIVIDKNKADLSNNRITMLSDDIWDLPTQIDDLEKWLKDEGKDLKHRNEPPEPYD